MSIVKICPWKMNDLEVLESGYLRGWGWRRVVWAEAPKKEVEEEGGESTLGQAPEQEGWQGRDEPGRWDRSGDHPQHPGDSAENYHAAERTCQAQEDSLGYSLKGKGGATKRSRERTV